MKFLLSLFYVRFLRIRRAKCCLRLPSTNSSECRCVQKNRGFQQFGLEQRKLSKLNVLKNRSNLMIDLGQWDCWLRYLSMDCSINISSFTRYILSFLIEILYLWRSLFVIFSIISCARSVLFVSARIVSEMVTWLSLFDSKYFTWRFLFFC